MPAFLPRSLPEELQPLADLALDLRWTWSHAGDALWKTLSPEDWERTRNPWLLLQDVPKSQLERMARDARFVAMLRQLAAERQEYLGKPGWYDQAHPNGEMGMVAYFSMEFGLSESLPLYAGGLGILAGDYLKAASDLAVPLVGVGLLYQEGYFRQMLDAAGNQLETYPYNDPTSLPIQPVLNQEDTWLHIPLDLPGRILLLRVWRANVGRVRLYLLDTNDPLNSPADRGITSKLYGGGTEIRLLQELVLGIGGWRALEAERIPIDVCHLNEGHAAFAVIERARRWMRQTGRSFQEAVWATRAGNVFTTHTPVAAGFDTFPPGLIERYFPDPPDLAAGLLTMGRRGLGDPQEPLNMAYLAMRGCSTANGVSRLHGAVSRGIFQTLYPRWPRVEVPVGSITNGVHVPSWDSAWADALWTEACGKERWRGDMEPLTQAIEGLADEALWTFRIEQVRDLIRYARGRLARQLGQRGAEAGEIERAGHVLDPNVLTIGFARRFAEYKRPTLLLHDPERLGRLLTDPARPVQLIVAGKAHPTDDAGKQMVQAWVEFVTQPAVRRHAVFLEDYDMALAQELVQGVDVWINTPRRPWEACGTSGMKVLVNGGLNLSELDGWWAEASAPEVGWALGDGRELRDPHWDATEAAQLYSVLEHEIVPEFYDRNPQGVPRAWLARMRASMGRLAPQFSSTRMLREYVEALYLPAVRALHRRMAQGGQLASDLCVWRAKLRASWAQVRFGTLEVRRDDDRLHFTVQVYLGEIDPEWVRVELYAEPARVEEKAQRVEMERVAEIPGAANGFGYRGSVPASRPAEDFTPRVIPLHPEALHPDRSSAHPLAAMNRHPEIEPGGPLPLGAYPWGSGINFAAFSQHATGVSLLLFDTPENGVPSTTLQLDPQRHRTGDIWHVWVKGIRHGQAYAFRASGPYDPVQGHRFNAHKVLLDPYATALTGTERWDFSRAFGFDPRSPLKDLSYSEDDDAPWVAKSLLSDRSFDWQEDRRPGHPWSETVIYETHVRGLTIHPSSRATHPGTFLGVVEKIPYLKDLGITAVELLPVQEFNEREVVRLNPLTGERLRNYWGYSTVGFFAPKETYSSRTAPGCQVAEFKTMVRELHQAGIEVILDVVFNHTAEGSELGPTLNFRGFDNSVYYLLDTNKRFYKDYSGCGNTLNCGHPVVRGYILDCLRYWVGEMHVDGFRFDLASVLDRDEEGNLVPNPPLLESIADDPILREVKLIAEAWDAGGAFQIGTFPGRRWSEWNARFRDDVRRFWRGDAGMVGVFATRLCGSADLYQRGGKEPVNSINFVTCHDGFTLNDVVSYERKHNEANGENNWDGMTENYGANYGAEGPTPDPGIEALRVRQIKNLLATLFVSRGVPMLLGGDEFRRTQGGNNNAYCQDNPTSWYDWTLVDRHREVHRFAREMIALRGRHPVLRAEAFYTDKGVLWFGPEGRAPEWNASSNALGCRIVAGGEVGQGGYGLCLLFNADAREQRFTLPTPPEGQVWRGVADTALPAPSDIREPGRERPLEDQRYYSLRDRSAVVLASG